MKRRLPLIALLASLLGGCDNPTIVTRVDFVHGGLVSTIRASGSAFVESHGAPFAGVTPEAIAARLKLPASYPAGFRFMARAPGPRPERDGLRLVLHFNPVGPPDGYTDCTRMAEARTRPPALTGFTVTGSWCQGERLFATGHLEAPRVAADDPAAFSEAMLRLLIEITRDSES